MSRAPRRLDAVCVPFAFPRRPSGSTAQDGRARKARLADPHWTEAMSPGACGAGSGARPAPSASAFPALAPHHLCRRPFHERPASCHVDELSLLFTGQRRGCRSSSRPPACLCLRPPSPASLPAWAGTGFPHRPGHGPCPFGRKTHVCSRLRRRPAIPPPGLSRMVLHWLGGPVQAGRGQGSHLPGRLVA